MSRMGVVGMMMRMRMMRTGFGLFFGGFAVLREEGMRGGDNCESVKEEKRNDRVDMGSWVPS
jgi:hypothetical protein